jgi:mannan endo-1,4-beta-mannosidase
LHLVGIFVSDQSQEIRMPQLRVVLITFVLSIVAIVSGSNAFVSRDGNSLIFNGKKMRFGGANAYWLGLDQNDGGINYPTHFRVDDALATAKLMGATVVRSHTLGISTGNPLSFECALDVWNHKALEPIDYAVSVARNLGLKLIVPLTDNWHYYHGGKHDFTQWFNVSESEFYTNEKVIAAFENYIFHLLNHTNQYTGIRYGDDPTVLAWETGNEIRPPVNWTARLSTYIKSIANNHLVLSGWPSVQADELPLPNVDLYSDHYYPPNPAEWLCTLPRSRLPRKSLLSVSLGGPTVTSRTFSMLQSRVLG